MHRKYVGIMFGDLGWSDAKLDWVARWDVRESMLAFIE
jgi:hypothetical protein